MKENKEHIQTVEEIVNSARMGLWSIELYDGQKPRMDASDMMLDILGIDAHANLTQEQVYDAWYSNVCPSALNSVNESVAKMLTGKHDENTYKWHHPKLGVRYVRCGGVGHFIEGRGYELHGYHYDVTEQMRHENERNVVIDALAKTYMCLFYVDLETGSYTSYYNDVSTVKKVVPASGYLSVAFDTFEHYLVRPEYASVIHQFADLSTLKERLEAKDVISTQFIGVGGYWCEATMRVSDRNDDGSISHFVLGIRNIDEQKRTELKQLAQIKENIEGDRHKLEFLQNMTHEIRTPLNAMFGFGQLLAMPDGSLTQEEKDQYFNYIFNSYNMLTMLIDDVLDLADASHGNYRTIVETVNVNEVCRNALNMAIIRKLEPVNMYFTTEVEEGYTIQSDSRRIQQLLVNYLTNACKHTLRGEIHLHCSITETPGHLTFSVTDTGEGIPANMAEGIFERYKKLNQSVQGSGLGLNICRIISEELNGKVMLDTHYTNGARFLFII